MTEVMLLGRRAVREIARYPEATIPTLFIPLFFLVVNIGQVSKTFPSTTPFLKGQGYVAFQLPVSLMFAVATATSGLALVTEISSRSARATSRRPNRASCCSSRCCF
jgi:ABC-2 type transport system permease protein